MIHVITTADMERLVGIPTPAADAPVGVTMRGMFDQGVRTEALCGVVVADLSGTRHEAASIRALRAEPGRFECEPMCGPCIRALTDASDR